MSQTESSPPAATQPAEPKRSSPIRLIVLLAVLGVLLIAFLVDMFVMYDSVNAAAKRLNAAAMDASASSIEGDSTGFLPREGVVKAIGFEPTNSRIVDGKLVEKYRWWGAIPLERRFLEVNYDDEEGEKYQGYTISNANIFGQDVDEEAKPVQQEPGADPEAPVPGAPTGPAAPMPVPGPMPPAGKGNEGAVDPTPDKEEASSATPVEDADKPVEDADKDDDSTEE